VAQLDTQRKLPQRKHPRLSLDLYREGHVFFTTLCTHDRYRWFERYPELTRQAVATLLELSKDRGAVVYAWSVLPDHLHLLVQDDDLVQFVRLLKGRMTPLARAIETGRRLWQASFYDHALRRQESLRGVAGYIWENPVRSGLVEDPLAYPWSGSQAWPDWKTVYGDNP